MVTVEIEGDARAFEEAEESWMNQQINLRRRDGEPVCVKVTIRSEAVNIVLISADCPHRVRGGRAPNPMEKRLLDLWRECGLYDPDFRGGHLIAFLKQMRRELSL